LSVARYDLSPPQWPSNFPLKIGVVADLHACDPWMSLDHIDGARWKPSAFPSTRTSLCV
jgi:uncharacterized protein